MNTRFLKITQLIVAVSSCTGAVIASASSNIVTTEKLSWRLASQLAADAVGICASRGYSVTATVVDTTGHQQAVVKGDTVPLQSPVRFSYPVKGPNTSVLVRSGVRQGIDR